MDVPDGWRLDEDALVRSFAFKDFAEAFSFLTQVAAHAEAAGHHPDFCLSWNKVDFRLTTHSAGRVTKRDMELAEGIRRIAG